MRRHLPTFSPALEAMADGSTFPGSVQLLRAKFIEAFKEDSSKIEQRDITAQEILEEMHQARKSLQSDIDIREAMGYVPLGELARYLSIDEVLVRNVPKLQKELKRIVELCQIREHKYFPAYLQYLERMEKIFRTAYENPINAVPLMTHVFSSLDIPELRRQLTQTEHSTDRGSKLRTFKRSAAFLGDWYLADDPAVRARTAFPYKETVVTVHSENSGLYSSNKVATSFKPLEKQECLAIINTIETGLQALRTGYHRQPELDSAVSGLYDEFFNFQREYYVDEDFFHTRDGLDDDVLSALKILKFHQYDLHYRVSDMIREVEKKALKVFKTASRLVEYSIHRMR